MMEDEDPPEHADPVRFAELKRERLEDLRASVDYFAVSNKEERERQTVRELLLNLGTRFRLREIVSVPRAEEPPDVRFRTASFEVKEILDEERERHREYKELLATAERATTIEEVFALSRFTPRDATL